MRLRSVRADPDERARTLPGDDRIPRPLAVYTHGVTLRAGTAAVWPWLVQMGGGRAGWYSYDAVDNAGEPSARELIPEFQDIAPGVLLPFVRGAAEGFIVLDLAPERHLVLATVPPNGGTPTLTWTFVLTPVAGGSRLVVRARVGRGYRAPLGLPLWTLGTLVRFGHFVMQRRQLHGIARRVEGAR